VFFYLGFVGPQAIGARPDDLPHAHRLWLADNVIDAYGLDQLLADLDAQREYWREGDSLVHSVLDWIATEGFDAFFSRMPNWDFHTAADFRHRYLIGLGKALSGR
jgi:hypothetical protein